jgi:hypothetical protein
MTAQTLLFHFLNASSEDARISPGHISLYLVLVKCWTENNFEDPFPIIRDQVMNRARSMAATYQIFRITPVRLCVVIAHPITISGKPDQYGKLRKFLANLKVTGNAGEQPGKR